MNNKGQFKPKSDIERFSKYIVKPDGCWEWVGAKTDRGYGAARVRGRFISAHRFAAYLFLGLKIPDKRVVMHRCDNPPCVNPEHLVLASQSENIRDCVRKGRHTKASNTHCPKGHPYSGDNLATWKGNGRTCRICSRAYNKSYYKRTKRGKAKQFMEEWLGAGNGRK